ncbi:MAG: hypothetical protein WCO84_03275 [bacterium]
MDILPGENFFKRVLILTLITGGYFYFSSGTRANITNTENGTIQKIGNAVVFSRNKDSGSPKMNEINDLNIVSQNPETSTASVSNAINPNNLTQLKLSDLNIDNNNTTKDLQTYAKNLSLALKPYSTDGIPNELDLMLQVAKNLDNTALNKIRLLSQFHALIAKDLSNIQVPSSAGWRHLNLTNNCLKISYLDSQIANNINDPKKLPLLLNDFQTETKLFISTINDLNQFFLDKKIIFNDNNAISIKLKF